MSISSEISRISGNVSDALTAISNKGVAVPSGSNSDDLASLIGQISGGGGTTTIIIPEQTINVSSSYTQIQFNNPLVAGEEYVWTIDGVTGTLTAVSQYGSVFLLTTSMGIIFDYSAPNMYVDTQSSQYYGTHTVKVVQQSGGGGGGSTLITKTITQNGTYNASSDNADGYSSVTVNVSGGGGGLVYETGTWTPASDTASYTISFSNTHSTAPFFYMITDTGAYNSTSNSNHQFTFWSSYILYGTGIHYSSSSDYYALGAARYRASSATTISNASTTVSSAQSIANYATSTGIEAYSSSSSRYWRSGRTYKWIAVWAPTT